MKKQITQIIMTIGFIVFVIGNIVVGAETGLVVFSLVHVGALLAAVFVFSKNETLKKVSYGLGALEGAYGIACLAFAFEEETGLIKEETGLIIASVGLILLLVSSLIYFTVVVINFFGFTKDKDVSCGNNLSDVLIKYKEMEEEKVITEEEYEELKRKALQVTKPKSVGLDDLKKWKKLLDQQVITEEEFSAMKADIFKK